MIRDIIVRDELITEIAQYYAGLYGKDKLPPRGVAADIVDIVVEHIGKTLMDRMIS